MTQKRSSKPYLKNTSSIRASETEKQDKFRESEEQFREQKNKKKHKKMKNYVIFDQQMRRWIM